MRRAFLVMAVVVGLLTGCGGEGGEPDLGGRYLDPRADLVAAISLDYDGEDWAQVKRLYARAVRSPQVRRQIGDSVPIPHTLDGALNVVAGFEGLSFTDDVRPLLGGRLLIGTRTTPPSRPDGEPSLDVTAVYRVSDPEALDRVLRKLRSSGLETTPMRGFEDVRDLGGGVAVAGGDTIVAVLQARDDRRDAVLRERLRAAAKGKGPAVPGRTDALVDLTVRPAWLGRLESREGLRFEDEVLRQFSGPSATLFRPGTGGDTEFAARSTLRDPARMRELLPRLAPALPGILEGLEGLRAPGLALLLFTAPDAPLTPQAFGLLRAVRVKPLGAADLYAVSGLDPRNGRPLPDGLVYGVIGDVFVVGSTRELAERAATMPVASAKGAGARLRVDLGRLRASDDGGPVDPFTLALAQTLFTAVEADASAVDGDVVAHARARTKP
jgi:hypothetical protein